MLPSGGSWESQGPGARLGLRVVTSGLCSGGDAAPGWVLALRVGNAGSVAGASGGRLGRANGGRVQGPDQCRAAIVGQRTAHNGATAAAVNASVIPRPESSLGRRHIARVRAGGAGSGGTGERLHRRGGRCMDDVDGACFREALRDNEIRLCVPGGMSRDKAFRDKRRNKLLNRTEIIFGRLNDRHRIASRSTAAQSSVDPPWRSQRS